MTQVTHDGWNGAEPIAGRVGQKWRKKKKGRREGLSWGAFLREAGHSLSPAYRRVCACGHELAGPSLTTDQGSRASATSGVRSLAVWDLQTYLRVSSSAAVKVVVARIQRWRFMNFSGLGCFLRLVACELKRLRMRVVFRRSGRGAGERRCPKATTGDNKGRRLRAGWHGPS